LGEGEIAGQQKARERASDGRVNSIVGHGFSFVALKTLVLLTRKQGLKAAKVLFARLPAGQENLFVLFIASMWNNLRTKGRMREGKKIQSANNSDGRLLSIHVNDLVHRL